MLDIRKLKELIRLMVENELTEIDLKDEKETVSLRREGSQAPTSGNVHCSHILAPHSSTVWFKAALRNGEVDTPTS